jgi:hypothetical protein
MNSDNYPEGIERFNPPWLDDEHSEEEIEDEEECEDEEDLDILLLNL